MPKTIRDPYYDNFVDLVGRYLLAMDNYHAHGLPESLQLMRSLQGEVRDFIADHANNTVFGAPQAQEA